MQLGVDSTLDGVGSYLQWVALIYFQSTAPR